MKIIPRSWKILKKNIIIFPELGDAIAYDRHFQGPKRERSNTDVIFSIVFAIVILAWMAMGIWGNERGHA